MTQIVQKIAAIDRTVTEGEGQRNLLADQLAVSHERGNAAAQSEKLLNYGVTVLPELEQAWRTNFQTSLATVVSHGLTGVFGEEIKVTVEDRIVRDTASMELKLTHKGVEIGNILDGTGGSIVAVLNVLLHILLLVSVDPPLRRVLILDEPFRMVESRHLPAIGQLLREMSERLGIQFIIVSHERELEDAADIVHEVRPDGTVKVIHRRAETQA